MKYINNDSYEEYKNNQTITNIRKLNNIWITDHEINSIIDYIKKNNINIRNGICHGARNGYEVMKFRSLLNSNIIGTDISETATKFDNMIQWDMHDKNDSWISYFDFIYSNSIDHSYDFNLCLDVWMQSLSKHGICCIQWSNEISKPYNKSDCFGIEKADLINLINTNYIVSEVIDVNGRSEDTIVIIIQHKK